MKKIISLLLAMLLLALPLFGCKSSTETTDETEEVDKGSEIPIFLAAKPYDLDPGVMYNDVEMLKYFGLLYEGLTSIDENGKLQKALAKEWKYEVDPRDDYLKLYFTLNNTSWSDGIPVDADDVAYAWKRILLPESSNNAASLLFPILNAKAVKAGTMTIDDVGISAVSDKVLEVTFEKNFTDIDYFLRVVASPALVPLREDVVSKDAKWAQPLYIKSKENPDAISTIITNGPFTIKIFTQDYIVLERSIYYRNLREEQKPDKYVTPYRLVINFKQDLEGQASAFDKKELFFLSDLTKERFDSFKKKKVSNELSTYTYFFNTKNKIFSNEKVRQALSLALDRTEIAKIVGGGVTAATGFVPEGTFDVNTKSQFRKAGGDLISKNADLEKAKSLLKEAGVSSGSFKISCKSENAWEADVAEYAKGVWDSLGFKVTVEKISNMPVPSGSQKKSFGTLLSSGEFDVIGLDYVGLTDDAYSFVVPFATEYSGSVVSVDYNAASYSPHITGFEDKEYNALIDKVYAAKDAKERTALYHQAEELLLQKAPIAPLFFQKDAYVISGELSKVTTNIFGQHDFMKAKLRNYEKYKYLTASAGAVEKKDETSKAAE